MSASFSSSVSYDHTTGQDIAHKMGQEKSGLQAKGYSDLYSGAIPDLLASTNRIRDIQKYLGVAGFDQSGIEAVPRTRLSSSSESASHSI